MLVDLFLIICSAIAFIVVAFIVVAFILSLILQNSYKIGEFKIKNEIVHNNYYTEIHLIPDYFIDNITSTLNVVEDFKIKDLDTLVLLCYFAYLICETINSISCRRYSLLNRLNDFFYSKVH